MIGAYTRVFFIFLDFEASFIRFLDKLTNGSKIVVNETGRYIII